MDHYSGITPNERYNNDVLAEMRKQTALLEQLVRMNKPQVSPMKQPVKKQTRTRKTS